MLDSHPIELNEEERHYILHGYPNEYLPSDPTNFNYAYQDLISSQQIRVMKKRHQRAQKEAAALSSSMQVNKGPRNPPKDEVAYKIMNKYGFKQGSGLGKSEQGITTPLVVEKTGRKIGKIVHENQSIFI